ncbi:hydroxyacylglutathione hydrolase [uncultured Roseburia sp.]|uniref:MBL fold metallo-hydrolase n=1 Tax=Brotonthovivens ammoniilytica TaxID=2981725 RepID=A0ABT2TI36_9FIRM|nr:MBL fold metallo-hydrolase [Brotonthovivens ammoniilytica]MCU6761873.1 MBL fold metallo-hydrolase [Brotonthovivens ammoniilytica]SCI49186.1 hydroxyacylglutathione hydrolase [uncultured Roseburia sp.]
MADLKIEEYQVGAISTNCYFLINSDTKEVLIVDPGGSTEMLETKIRQEQLKPVAVLLTHGHFDHASGAEDLKNTYGIQIYAHADEKYTLEDPQINLSTMLGISEQYHADVYVREGEVLHLGGFDLEVLHTPGHTEGGVCYYLKEQKVLVSGDTLFCTSIGRTDFPNGSFSDLIRSIKEKLMVLPDDVQVLPGHEGKTYIGYERDHNPYL